VHFVHYYQQFRIAILGTIVALVVAGVVSKLAAPLVAKVADPEKRYKYRKLLSTIVVVLAAIAIGALWAPHVPHASTFYGLIGAGLAVALREPLLSVAGRIAIFTGNIYTAGDRIEINKMKGDVLDIGFFYTRLMEIGNWLSAEQTSGRIVQFPNAQIFGAAVFNYTQNFDYLWDEVKLPLTYDSNIHAATEILLEVGRAYSADFLKGAEEQLDAMRRYFYVPKVELEPQVYVCVNSNWIELAMRYVVQAKKRRAAQTFIWNGVFDRVQGRKDLAIGSSTMDLTVHGKEARSSEQLTEESPRDGKKAA